MADRALLLADFARACKAAARVVSLYPGAHPAIQSALTRITAASARLTSDGSLTLTVLPDGLTDGGPAPDRPDPAIAELAALLHGRLVGAITIEQEATADDWRALLLLLAVAPDDLQASGGIARAWTATGRQTFTIREIDYAEVLRERSGDRPAAESPDWDQIIACCLHGDATSIDERALARLLEIPGDSTRLAEVLDRLEHAGTAGAVSLSARAAALLHLLREAVEAAGRHGVSRGDALESIAGASAHLTPDMMLALLAERGSENADRAALATGIVDRLGDASIAAFVSRSVVADGGATERLACAFQALVPDVDRREPVLAIAHDEAATGLGDNLSFEQLWQNAAHMLTSYRDDQFVSTAYARELSGARSQALDIDRLADDPPERVQAWLSTVTPGAIDRMDLSLIVDLVRIENGAVAWAMLTEIVISEIDRRAADRDWDGALTLASSLAAEAGGDGRPALAMYARSALDRLASGALTSHLVRHLRRTDSLDAAVPALCQAIGPCLAAPLAEALASEQQPRAIRHLRDLLLGFGAAGRQSVEQLRTSSNPSVRRTAVDLLRVFGGSEALPELTSMLDDADPQVQREAVRAIVQIGTPDALAVLQRAIVGGGTSTETLAQQLIGLRDERAVPLLCSVLERTRPRGPLLRTHLEILDALGGLGGHREAVRALGDALRRGDWWAPRRTAALRAAAAAALRRINSPAAMAALDEAEAQGGRGVRAAVAAVRGRATA